MNTWTRTGPVVVEVDGTVENQRVVDYASDEALRCGAELVLVAPYSPHGSFPAMPEKTSAELADDALRAEVARLRYRSGYATELAAISGEGSRTRVLAHAAKDARMMVVGRSRNRGAQRLVHT